MTRHCRAALESDEPADVKLRAALLSYVDDLQNHPELFLLFSESQHSPRYPMPTASPPTPRLHPHPVAIVEEGVGTGVFRDDLEPRLVTHGILGMHNWIHRWYAPRGRCSLTEIGEVFAEMILSVLRPDQARIAHATGDSSLLCMTLPSGGLAMHFDINLRCPHRAVGPTAPHEVSFRP